MRRLQSWLSRNYKHDLLDIKNHVKTENYGLEISCACSNALRSSKNSEERLYANQTSEGYASFVGRKESNTADEKQR